MRRDVFIQNDSRGFSVLAATAADEFRGGGWEHDVPFVKAYKALLLELYGDDSMPVRIVVDEPLLPEEEAQWLARATWRVDAPDGRLLVMGGFDPDIVRWWKEQHGPDGDGQGVAVVKARPGSWKVDVYAHVGSMNGRAILSEADEKPGAFFRRCHPDRAFPLWFAKMLDFSGEDDAGHEELWKDVVKSVKDGRLRIDTEPASAIGFLVHLTPFTGSPPEPPAEAWIARDAGRRLPEVFPLGLAAAVPDPDLEYFLDKLLARPKPAEVIPVATRLVEIIEVWSGDPLKRLGGGDCELKPADAFHLYWMAALAADSSPRFELWVTPKGPWTPPESCPEFAVVSKGAIWALGPPPHTLGWFTWWAAGMAAKALAGVPDGSTLDLAMAKDASDDEKGNPAAGRALFSGDVKGGAWHIAEASPAVTREALDAALRFVRDLVAGERISVRGDAERRAFDAAVAGCGFLAPTVAWEGDTVRLAEPNERMLLMLAVPVFRTRFAAQWPCDPIGADEGE